MIPPWVRRAVRLIPGAVYANRFLLAHRRQLRTWWHELRDASRLRRLAADDALMDQLPPKLRADWDTRIRQVMEDENNQFIERHPMAGRIIGRHLIMHNGIKVNPLSYYEEPMLKLLIDNRGVHEPDEEMAFRLVLGLLPKCPVMMELGAYWAFYSMWFLRETQGGKSYLLEPSVANLDEGKKNFRINSLEGTFICEKVGDHSTNDAVTVDELIGRFDLKSLHILHSDIQGAESQMLDGSGRALSEETVWFLFISTHSNGIHDDCLAKLRAHDYQIVRETNLDQTTSVDGLIVACSPTVAHKYEGELRQLRSSTNGKRSRPVSLLSER